MSLVECKQFSVDHVSALSLQKLQLKVGLLQVLEKDLAVFGFFIALGRSTRSFLLTNGFETLDDPMEDFIRYNLFKCFPCS